MRDAHFLVFFMCLSVAYPATSHGLGHACPDKSPSITWTNQLLVASQVSEPDDIPFGRHALLRNAGGRDEVHFTRVHAFGNVRAPGVADAHAEGIDQSVLDRKAAQGVDFAAMGNEPFWGLDIDFGNEMSLRVLGKEPANTPVPRPILDRDGKSIRYRAATEAGILEVAIFRETCVDTMSGEVFSRRVEVQRDGASYSGCGKFINRAYRIHDIWVLTRFDQRPIRAQDFPDGPPMLEVHLESGLALGSTGCTTFSARVEVDGNRIGFLDVVPTTLLDCPADLESDFWTAVRSIDRFEIDEGTLTLYADNRPVLTWKKVD